MANALKCDRCGSYFDYDPKAKYNFIAFGHKDIIIGKNFPVKDICPGCMREFLVWFEHSKAIFTVTDVVFDKEEWTDEDCDGIGCWECKYFRQDKNIHNPYDTKDAYYCAYKKLYISGNVTRPDYMDMRYTDFDKLGCKEEEK